MNVENMRLEEVRWESMRHFGFGEQVMQEMKVCSACGAPEKIWQKYCRSCGMKLPEETLYETYKRRHKTCPVCDTILSEQTEYCPQCGRNKHKEEKL